MSLQVSRYSAEETARRGDEIYEQRIRSLIEDGSRGKVVAIDIESGAYVVAENALSASKLLLAQSPNAEIWCARVGSRALYQMGGISVRVKFEQAFAKISGLVPEEHDRL